MNRMRMQSALLYLNRSLCVALIFSVVVAGLVLAGAGTPLRADTGGTCPEFFGKKICDFPCQSSMPHYAGPECSTGSIPDPDDPEKASTGCCQYNAYNIACTNTDVPMYQCSNLYYGEKTDEYAGWTCNHEDGSSDGHVCLPPPND